MSIDIMQLTPQRLSPANYPALADLLTASFKGKFALALGWDEPRRAQRLAALLPTGIICPGLIFGLSQADRLVATFTIRTAATAPTAAAFAEAWHILTHLPPPARLSPLRAWWAVTLLRHTGGPSVGRTEGYVDNVAVDPALRGQGIATHLVNLVYAQSTDLGLDVLIADVMSSNQQVIALYRRAGWRITGRNYWLAPLTWPLLGTPGILHIRKELDHESHA